MRLDLNSLVGGLIFCWRKLLPAGVESSRASTTLVPLNLHPRRTRNCDLAVTRNHYRTVQGEDDQKMVSLAAAGHEMVKRVSHHVGAGERCGPGARVHVKYSTAERHGMSAPGPQRPPAPARPGYSSWGPAFSCPVLGTIPEQGPPGTD
jgi:hypothetical protein